MKRPAVKLKRYEMALNSRIIAAFLLAVTCHSFAQTVSEPQAPVVTDDRKQSAEKTVSMPATVVFASGDRLKGRIVLVKESFTIPKKESITGAKETIKYSDVSEIAVRRWCPKDMGRGGYLFRPCSVEVKLFSGSLCMCQTVNILEGFSFIDGKGRRHKFYGTFYDYLKKGKWGNSGSGERRYPETNPHRETAVLIVFEREKANPAGIDILKYLKF